jgi:hypothetical protein
MIGVRRHLGLSDAEIDHRKGKIRSEKATHIGRRGFYIEQKLYSTLLERFHEPYVHNQARVVLPHQLMKVDFIVYHREGKFIVDVFYPDHSSSRFANNVAMKFGNYTNFPLKTFLVVGNPKVTHEMIESNNLNAHNKRNKNLTLVTFEEFLTEIQKYQPLQDPYL